MVKPAMATNNPIPSHEIKYKGVRKRKWGKWVSEIRLPNCRDRIWLGSYDSPEKAARAFDAALFLLRGRRANFNFPDTPFEINIGTGADQTLTPQEIQVVATRFANEQEDNNNNNIEGEGEEERGSPMNIDKEESSDSVTGANSFEEVNNAVTQTGYTCAHSSPSSMYNGSCLQVEDMDLSFFHTLDNYSDGFTSTNDLGLYSGMHSGEIFYPTSPQPLQDNETIGNFGDFDDHAFSHQSFLWNF
ncbi:hypothetical protein L6164_015653 [Bauhinia variegata]|uniref:Uncharacterized protein n=1 Tax=Bauhinia variegata TaxID=167791 RepID=A0ACB9NLA8_BAUVA|nr:hypothetical protein L6164_015653 [Bauhinia variegata]